MKDEYKVFARNLKLYMEHYNITQKELADKLGVTRAAVSWYVSGDRLPKFGIFGKLLEIFDCSQDDLLGKETSLEYIAQQEKTKTIIELINRLNADGIAKVCEYLKDLHPKFYQ